jgi:hypothetical protein
MESGVIMKAKVTSVFLIIIIPLFLAGCNGKVQSQQENGLQIHNLSIAMGALDSSNFDEQKVTYSLNLTNSNNMKVYIKSIEPIVGDSIKKKILSDSITLDVDKVCKQILQFN